MGKGIQGSIFHPSGLVWRPFLGCFLQICKDILQGFFKVFSEPNFTVFTVFTNRQNRFPLPLPLSKWAWKGVFNNGFMFHYKKATSWSISVLLVLVALIVSSSTIDQIYEIYTFYENRYEIYPFYKNRYEICIFTKISYLFA